MRGWPTRMVTQRLPFLASDQLVEVELRAPHQTILDNAEVWLRADDTAIHVMIRGIQSAYQARAALIGTAIADGSLTTTKMAGAVTLFRLPVPERMDVEWVPEAVAGESDKPVQLFGSHTWHHGKPWEQHGDTLIRPAPASEDEATAEGIEYQGFSDPRYLEAIRNHNAARIAAERDAEIEATDIHYAPRIEGDQLVSVDVARRWIAESPRLDRIQAEWPRPADVTLAGPSPEARERLAGDTPIPAIIHGQGAAGSNVKDDDGARD